MVPSNPVQRYFIRLTDLIGPEWNYYKIDLVKHITAEERSFIDHFQIKADRQKQVILWQTLPPIELQFLSEIERELKCQIPTPDLLKYQALQGRIQGAYYFIQPTEMVVIENGHIRELRFELTPLNLPLSELFDLMGLLQIAMQRYAITPTQYEEGSRFLGQEIERLLPKAHTIRKIPESIGQLIELRRLELHPYPSVYVKSLRIPNSVKQLNNLTSDNLGITFAQVPETESYPNRINALIGKPLIHHTIDECKPEERTLYKNYDLNTVNAKQIREYDTLPVAERQFIRDFEGLLGNHIPSFEEVEYIRTDLFLKGVEDEGLEFQFKPSIVIENGHITTINLDLDFYNRDLKILEHIERQFDFMLGHSMDDGEFQDMSGIQLADNFCQKEMARIKKVTLSGLPDSIGNLSELRTLYINPPPRETTHSYSRVATNLIVAREQKHSFHIPDTVAKLIKLEHDNLGILSSRVNNA